MKRILLIICCVALSSTAFAQGSFKENRKAIHSFFDQYDNNEDVTLIEIGPGMIRLMAGSVVKINDSDDKQTSTLIKSIKSIEIMVFDSEAGMRSVDIFDLLEECQGFELITRIKSGADTNNFYFATHDDSEMCEFLMLSDQSDQKVVLYITGNFSVSDISALSTLGEGMK